MWGEVGKILLIGADNRNVLAWSSNGFAKKGLSVTLNQETATWIASRKLIVESFFLRSGHNFSADWMSRSDLDSIID